ncbi:MAG: DUF3187 family protein [Pseudomonadota bacterium]
MIKSGFIFSTASFVIAVSFSLHANPINNPILTSNRYPFVQVFHLPKAVSGKLIEPDAWKSALQFEWSNSFYTATANNELLFIDGESYRTTASAFYGLSHHWELGIELPYVAHTGGVLDNAIETWHDWFDLPNADREDFPQDEIAFIYRRNGEDIFNLNDSANGMGGLTFHVGYQWYRQGQEAIAWRSGVKLPTGNAEKFTDSEGTDIFSGIYYSNDRLIALEQWSLHASVGLLYTSDGKLNEDSRKNTIFYASSTVAWQIMESLSLKIQLDGHTGFYDSELKELNDASIQIAYGGSFALGKSWFIDLTMTEDIQVAMSPDVVFQLGVRSLY